MTPLSAVAARATARALGLRALPGTAEAFLDLWRRPKEVGAARHVKIDDIFRLLVHGNLARVLDRADDAALPVFRLPPTFFGSFR